MKTIFLASAMLMVLFTKSNNNNELIIYEKDVLENSLFDGLLKIKDIKTTELFVEIGKTNLFGIKSNDSIYLIVGIEKYDFQWLNDSILYRSDRPKNIYLSSDYSTKQSYSYAILFKKNEQIDFFINDKSKSDSIVASIK